MSGLAYVALPVSGLIAYLLGSDERKRFHGLQAIALGLLWPLALYAASAASPQATRIVFLAGAAVWLLFTVLAAAGRDPRLPFLGRFLRRVAAGDPRSE